MTDQPNFESEAALAWEREYDTKRTHLDGRLRRKLQQIEYHEAQLKKLEDQAAARRKSSKELERAITKEKHTVKEARKEYADAIVEFHAWTKEKHKALGQKIERFIEDRLERSNVKLKSLKYDDIVVDADK